MRGHRAQRQHQAPGLLPARAPAEAIDTVKYLKPLGHAPEPSEILPSLWIGDRFDATEFDGILICVLEGNTFLEPDSHTKAVWFPIVTEPILAQLMFYPGANQPSVVIDPNAPRVKKERLKEAAKVIADALATGKKVMVYCNSGSERSPLTVVGYLMEYKGFTLEEAYAHVTAKRWNSTTDATQVMDRRKWIIE